MRAARAEDKETDKKDKTNVEVLGICGRASSRTKPNTASRHCVNK